MALMLGLVETPSDLKATKQGLLHMLSFCLLDFALCAGGNRLFQVLPMLPATQAPPPSMTLHFLPNLTSLVESPV
jgi:hypothetical protein